jgi:hypothetical protein
LTSGLYALWFNASECGSFTACATAKCSPNTTAKKTEKLIPILILENNLPHTCMTLAMNLHDSLKDSKGIVPTNQSWHHRSSEDCATVYHFTASNPSMNPVVHHTKQIP